MRFGFDFGANPSNLHGTLVAYYVHDLSPFIFQLPNGIGPRWYGFAYVMAFVVAYWLYKKLAQRGYSDLRPDQVGDFITWGAVFGVFLGGRLGYFLFYQPEELLRAPLTLFKVWEGGMASHGGIIGLFFYTLWYSWRHKVSWTNIGDNLVVVAPIGLFFGRIANFINGELYGRIAHVPWAVQFPKELEDPEIASRLLPQLGNGAPEMIISAAGTDPALREKLGEILNPRHPSQIYEALLEGVLLFAILWLIRTKTKAPNGFLTGVFFIAYALFRIFAEQFREPDASLFGPFTRGQFYSIFMVIVGATFLIWSLRKRTSMR
ncbi:MAG TPA: prolipoprotein diacylglyceryl transferase [Chthoniobacterales bacterium]